MEILKRSYVTPHTLRKMNCNVSDKCWHRCGMTGTLTHILWHCPEIQAFWLNVRDFQCKLFKINVPLCSAVGLLGKKYGRSNFKGIHSKGTSAFVVLAFLSVK